MKTWLALVLWLTLFVTTDLAASASAADRIRLTNGEWAPYLSEQLPHFGAASHIVTEAFNTAGIKVEYGFFPWKRSYKLAKEGGWQGTLVWVFTEERARDFLYSEVVIRDPEYLFHLRSRPLNWQTPEDLRGLTIGTTLHTVYPTLEKAAAEGILRLERAGNYDSLYQRLLKRRIDAIPQVSQVGRYYQQKTLTIEERLRITRSPTVVQERKYHLMLSKQAQGSAALLARFNAGLKTIQEDGTYDRIIQALKSGAYDR